MEIIFRHLSLSEIGAEQLLKMSKNTTQRNTIQHSHLTELYCLKCISAGLAITSTRVFCADAWWW